MPRMRHGGKRGIGAEAVSHGATYYFCSEEDKKEFQKHPLMYLRKQKAA